MDRQRLTILGSTGSVGTSTLDVVSRHRERFEVVALSARNQTEAMLGQCLQYRPRFAVMLEPRSARDLRQRLREAGVKCEVREGPEALEEIASLDEVDTVMAAIVGIAGLRPTLAAARAGKKILLANKESLVTSGAVLMDAARASGAKLLPIDSEHNAIFQALPRGYRTPESAGVRRILLTASGGPFRSASLKELDEVTPEQACAHPNWVMGRKISVDSATMMNKGLEVIEAHWLFNLPGDRIDVLIHPQSVIHSLVSYADGSVLAQLGNPDMRTPIAHALAFPNRVDSGVAQLDLAQIAQLSFEKPDYSRFPCLALAMKALSEGGVASAALNAANEIAVEAFLSRRIGFMAIAQVVDAVLNALPNREATSLAAVVDADAAARRAAHAFIDGLPAGARLTERAVQ